MISDQKLGQPRGRLVGQTAEHDVVHHRQLTGQRRIQARVPVPVHRGPPRTHGVEHVDLTPVTGHRQPRALRPQRDDG